MSFYPDMIWGSVKSRRTGALISAFASSLLPFCGAAAQNAASAPTTIAPAPPVLTPPPSGPVIQQAQAAAMGGPTGSAVVNLIRLLVEQGILTQDRANALIRQAEDEAAAAARGQLLAPGASPSVAPPSSVAATSGEPVAPQPSTSVRVPYIPEIVRRQIRDEVKQEVLQQAKDENWAAPNALPEWTKRFQLYGDFRLRY
jgi:hypothetical protein